MARALTQAFNFGIAVPVMMALTFIAFTATGGELTPRRVFTTLSLIGFLRRSSTAFIVRCFFLVYEARVAIVRIQVSRLCKRISAQRLALSQVYLVLQNLLEMDEIEGLPVIERKS